MGKFNKTKQKSIRSALKQIILGKLREQTDLELLALWKKTGSIHRVAKKVKRSNMYVSVHLKQFPEYQNSKHTVPLRFIDTICLECGKLFKQPYKRKKKHRRIYCNRKCFKYTPLQRLMAKEFERLKDADDHREARARLRQQKTA